MKKLSILFEENINEEVYGNVMTDVMNGGSKIYDVKFVNTGPNKSWGPYTYEIYMSHKIGLKSVWNVNININHGYQDCYLNHITVFDNDGNIVLKNDRDGYAKFFKRWLKGEVVDILLPLATKRDEIQMAYDEKSNQDSEDYYHAPYPNDWNSDWPNNEPQFDKESDLDKFEKER